jgi:hypothetical protein
MTLVEVLGELYQDRDWSKQKLQNLYDSCTLGCLVPRGNMKMFGTLKRLTAKIAKDSREGRKEECHF